MADKVIMPQVGQDIETAIITKWHVKEGDSIQKGDIVATVESDKASFEVEAFKSGTILKLLYQEGGEAKVFGPIAYIGASGEKLEEIESKTLSEPKQNSQTEAQNYGEPEKKQTGRDKMVEPSKSGKIFISPVAKKLAIKKGIPYEKIDGSGPYGRIIKRDVINYINKQPQEAQQSLTGVNARDNGSPHEETQVISTSLNEEDKTIEFTKMRKKIAERLTFSKQNIPHFYLYKDIDVTNLLSLRSQNNEKTGQRISINDILIKRVAITLRDFPMLNAHVQNEKIIVKSQINIGIAVSVQDGLLVPVIQDTDRKTLSEIHQLSRKNAENAKRGIVNNPVGGTFTVSNLGMFGIGRFQAIINPPECGILSIGAVEKRVVPFDQGIAIRDIMSLGLATDHRAADGAYAAQFLNSLKENIQMLKNLEI